MKPVFLITLCHRYHELCANVDRIHNLSPEKPEIIVVWGCEDEGRIWLLNEMVNKGKISKFIIRDSLPGETTPINKGTTYVESHNLWLGLSYIKENYEDAYAIVTSSDMELQPGALEFIKNIMEEGCQGLLIHYEGTVCTRGIWHTNFFVVNMNELIWPPISRIDDKDTLERQWGIYLEDKNFNICYTHNGGPAGGRFFHHKHTTESLPPFPYKINRIVGYKKYVKKQYERFRKWLKSLWNTIPKLRK